MKDIIDLQKTALEKGLGPPYKDLLQLEVPLPPLNVQDEHEAHLHVTGNNIDQIGKARAHNILTAIEEAVEKLESELKPHLQQDLEVLVYSIAIWTNS